MNKQTPYLLIGALILGLAVFGAGAETLDTKRWMEYCKKNTEKCAAAEQICEQDPSLDCEKVKNAFLNKQPLNESVIPQSSGD